MVVRDHLLLHLTLVSSFELSFAAGGDRPLEPFCSCFFPPSNVCILQPANPPDRSRNDDARFTHEFSLLESANTRDGTRDLNFSALLASPPVVVVVRGAVKSRF